MRDRKQLSRPVPSDRQCFELTLCQHPDGDTNRIRVPVHRFLLKPGVEPGPWRREDLSLIRDPAGRAVARRPNSQVNVVGTRLEADRVLRVEAEEIARHHVADVAAVDFATVLLHELVTNRRRKGDEASKLLNSCSW